VSSQSLTISAHPRRGGRTADITRRIHDATLALLAEGGHAECTFQNVAKKAGIERSTLYRRYPSRWAMLVEAWATRFAGGINIVPTDSFAADLRSHLERVAQTLNSPLGMAMVAAGAVARLDPDARATAGEFWKARLAQQEPFVAAAIARGELSADIDREALFAAADGPLYFRLLIVGRPIDPALVEQAARGVEAQFCGKATNRPGRRKETPS
jgi:AcrR family transcriptional regulator